LGSVVHEGKKKCCVLLATAISQADHNDEHVRLDQYMMTVM
jgi:hypothetical protein